MNLTTLNPVELATAQDLIDSKALDIYELKDIYGPALWAGIPKRKIFGRRFKQSTLAGELKNIQFMDRAIDNHALYKIGIESPET